jgi:hypothetical protein
VLLPLLAQRLDALAIGLRLPGCWNLQCTDHSGPSEAQLPTKRCAGCKVARYCSPACHKAHWPAHRASCKAAMAARQQQQGARG